MLLSVLALLLLCAVHLSARYLAFLEGVPRSRWLSAAGGMSLAYVFLHFMPELAHGQELVNDSNWALAWLEFELFAIALTGLLISLGLERLVQVSDAREEGAGADIPPDERLDKHDHGVFLLHLVSFAVYNLITGYLLLHRGESEAPGGLIAFAIAMALHLLVTDYGLRQAFPSGYRRYGRWILIAALCAGFLLALAITLPEIAILAIIALLGGGMVLNVLKEELPTERQSRFWAIVAGSVFYAGVLALMG